MIRRRVPILATISTVLLHASLACAHGGESHDPHPRDIHELPYTWGFEPLVVIGLALTAWLYVQGLVRTWRSAGVGHGLRRREAWCFAGGWFALFVALVSPLHPWGSVLFSAHMTQHEILMLVAAPLLVLGKPLPVWMRALPTSLSQGLARLANQPWWQAIWVAISAAWVAWIIHAIALWMWHIPALFQATLDSELIHTLQHLSFLHSAILFWWAIIHRSGVGAYGFAVLYMFTTAIHSGLLGVIITVARTLWYPAYARTTEAWGLTPLEDQQLGGLIMWIPGGLTYVIAALAFVAGWMAEADRRAKRATAGSLAETTPTTEAS
jgi:cytochrome c oxidase assembly factor CtaG